MSPEAENLRCPRCSTDLPPAVDHCPGCGAAVAKEKFRLPWRSWRTIRSRFKVHILAAALTAALIWAPHVLHWLRFQLPLRTSPLVGEAVTRAQDHPATIAKLGDGIAAGWFVKGFIRDDETGWSEARLWIPVSGSKAKGLLYASAGRTSGGVWVFSELRLSASDGAEMDLLSRASAPALPEGAARARIYLVPFGDLRGLAVHALPDHYRATLGLNVELLAPLPLERSAYDPARRQMVAEELIRAMKEGLPQLAADPSAFLIGITQEDMYVRGRDWNFAYNYYMQPRTAVISAARLKPVFYRWFGRERLLQVRVRKFVTRDLGVLVYRFPLNDDPTSVLKRGIWSLEDLDVASENFEGLGSRAVVNQFQEAHRQKPVAPEFAANAAKPAKLDGGNPCLLFQRKIDKNGRGVGAYSAKLTDCPPRAFLDGAVDELEADLDSGALITRRTDLFVPDVIPVAVTRCYRLLDDRTLPFGTRTNHAWDLAPFGSRQPYTYVYIVFCDGKRVHFDRVSKGTGYADAVYEHRETATPFFESLFSWNGNGWDLRLKNGSLMLFPEAYNAKRHVEGAIVGLSDARGNSVKVERTRQRDIERLTSPGGHWIAFDIDTHGRITKASDDAKRVVTYTYDGGGRLTLVDGPNGATRYFYDEGNLMAIEEDGKKLVDFRYFKDDVAQIALSDGKTYHMRYEYPTKNRQRSVRTFVQSPDGKVAKVDIPPPVR